MFDLLLIDMAGVMDESSTPAVLRIVRDRMRLSKANPDVVGVDFFLRATPGRADPAEIEQAVNDVQEYVLECSQGEVELLDYCIVMVIGQRTPRDFLLQVIEEFMQRTDHLPVVVALRICAKKDQRAALVDRKDLPLVWRCRIGEAVILNTDVWLDGESEATGARPAFPRGMSLTVVERAVYDGGRVHRERLLTVTTPQGQEAPFTLALPWQLVTHPGEWRVDRSRRAMHRAHAIFRLPCWYWVRAE